MQKSIILLILLLTVQAKTNAQSTMKLEDILSVVQTNHPSVKMYDADIRSSDEAAKGARSWEAPELGTGLLMTPYNPSLWKTNSHCTPRKEQVMNSPHPSTTNKKKTDPAEKYRRA